METRRKTRPYPKRRKNMGQTKRVLDESQLVKGTLQGNERGFCFLIPEDKETNSEDIFIPKRFLAGAMHKDQVFVRVTDKEKSSGEVAKIIKRNDEKIVGTFQKGKNNAFVIPDDNKYFCDFFIPRGKSCNAKNRDKVVVQITNYIGNGKNPEGKVVEVLGSSDDAKLDVISIAISNGLDLDFSPEVKKEAAEIPQTVPQKMIKKRRDLRGEVVFTIDGEDAKDLDDAISICKLENGNYLLGVHIADVTAYVKEGTELDIEASKRGTSNYFPGKVIPMLPKELSNGICSLNENVDRLTLSCEMEINEKGDVVSHDIFQSVIKTKRRMTYTAVTKMLEKDSEYIEKYYDISNEVELCGELAKILIAKRKQKGAIDFETLEAKFVFDKYGEVVDILPYQRGLSNRVIEEFMIIANETVAEAMFYAQIPFVYRSHEKISDEKLDDFLEFLKGMGIAFSVKKEFLKSKHFQQLLEKIEEESKRQIVSKVLLRNMQKAKYSSVATDHFGLSSEFYCHFTSPIRRYPDLFIHRVIKKMLNGGISEKQMERLESLASSVASHSTEREILADKIEREASDLKKGQFLSEMEGEEFYGMVSGVTSFGVFVQLENTCEGLARIENLPKDKYEFIEKMYTMKGRYNKFTLGEKVKIVVLGTERATSKVSFAIIGKEVFDGNYEMFE